MTASELKLLTRKDLTTMAKERGISGFSTLKKQDLVDIIIKDDRRIRRNAARRAARKEDPAKQTQSTNARKNGHQSSTPLQKRQTPKFTTGNGSTDKLTVTPKDSYWAEVHWSISGQKMARAKTSLGVEWPKSKAVLRLYEVKTSDLDDRALKRVSDSEIHGGVQRWFVQIPVPGKSYEVQIGFLSPTGRFYSLARSAMFKTIKPGSEGCFAQIPENGSEVRGEQPMSFGALRLKQLSESSLTHDAEFPMHVEAEIIMHGLTLPGINVRVQGEEVDLRPDGSFTVKYSLPNGRQVVQTVATCPETGQQHTLLTALERNTKRLEAYTEEDLV